jgi:SPP1 family predicted phage head-tail adaptor
MDVGELRHRIRFSNPLQGRDEKTGAEIKTLIVSTEIWAKVEFKEVGSTERMEADKLTAMTAADFTMRYRAGITTEMEIIHDGLNFKILSVLPDAKKCYMNIETVQIGELKEQSLVESDGETLVDSQGNAILWGVNADQNDNYTPPRLTFTNDDDEEFNQI